MAKRVAVIAGATGAAAKRLVEVLLADPEWTVVGLCRNPPPQTGQTPPDLVAANLTDPASTRAALARVPRRRTSSIPRATFSDATPASRMSQGNTAMLRNLLDAAEAAAPGLEHVHLVEGTKWYGMHLGALATPAREDDPRHMPPNFYYDQQDLLRARARKASAGPGRRRGPASSTTSRPSVRATRAVIGAWAAMCRELGIAARLSGHATPATTS